MEEIKKFLDINGLKKERMSEITGELEAKLLKLLPKNIVIKDDFDLNCYYIIFAKRL